MSLGPRAPEGISTSPTGGCVEYRLARNAAVREFKKGRLSRLDVCDAHPELMRAAQNIGVSTEDECPICEAAPVVHVTFAFGPGLPASGRCLSSPGELAKMWKRKDAVACYVVEVCVACRWNHLDRMFPAGRGIR